MGIVRNNLIDGVRSAYLIGIGGVGMSALARVLKHRGLSVSGSDVRENTTTRDLEQSGIPVYIGQKKISFEAVDLIIYSSAIRQGHLELEAARQMGLKVYHRAEILSSLLNQARTSIAVTGTHGKTTTTSMVASALKGLGRLPTCLIGGDVISWGTNTLLGDSSLWVSEVDESDGTHELYAPHYAIVTNLEEDHVDYYGSLDELHQSFAKFFENLNDPGVIIYSADDARLKNLVRTSGKAALSFGFDAAADFSAQNIERSSRGSSFDLYEAGFFVTRMALSVPGDHNISNALAAVALLQQLGFCAEEVKGVLKEFRGAGRRMEIRAQTDRLTVIDDYAHHPTEVTAVIRALKKSPGPLTVLFQPHRYSRTRYFSEQFACSLMEADRVILLPIYGAGEANAWNVSAEVIAEAAHRMGHMNFQVMAREEAILTLTQAELEGTVAFLGAGDIGELACEFSRRFKDVAAA